MMTDAVRCMADTRASPSWTPLSRMMRGALVGDGDDVFPFFGVEGEIGGMTFHKTFPPQTMRHSICGSCRLLVGDDTPLQSNLTRSANRSFNVAKITTLPV